MASVVIVGRWSFMAENYKQIFVWAIVENIVTIIAMVCLIFGLFWFGAGGWSLWGFLLMFNLNSVHLPIRKE